MPVDLKSLGIDRLSLDEKLDLARELSADISASIAAAPLTDAEREELERRLADDDANPDDVVSWADVKAEALLRWAK